MFNLQFIKSKIDVHDYYQKNNYSYKIRFPEKYIKIKVYISNNIKFNFFRKSCLMTIFYL